MHTNQTFNLHQIKTSEEGASLALAQEKGSVFGRLGEINEAQGAIPSHMKCLSTLDVKTKD